MKHAGARSLPNFWYTCILGTVMVLTAMAPRLVWADNGEVKEPSQSETSATGPADKTQQDYSGLADLVTMICEEALERFQGFYGPSVVTVTPFATIGFFEKNKQSELGMTLADQMTAMINNDTKDHLGRARGTTDQALHGLLQEVDGYLRVHLSGVNAAGERTSYIVVVEMSEPIYRALHTYL